MVFLARCWKIRQGSVGSEKTLGSETGVLEDWTHSCCSLEIIPFLHTHTLGITKTITSYLNMRWTELAAAKDLGDKTSRSDETAGRTSASVTDTQTVGKSTFSSGFDSSHKRESV